MPSTAARLSKKLKDLKMSEEKPKIPQISREQIAREIFNEPEHFMVCEGCGSICYRQLISRCKLCHSYRWNYDLASIQEKAQELGSREDTSVPME